MPEGFGLISSLPYSIFDLTAIADRPSAGSACAVLKEVQALAREDLGAIKDNRATIQRARADRSYDMSFPLIMELYCADRGVPVRFASLMNQVVPNSQPIATLPVERRPRIFIDAAGNATIFSEFTGSPQDSNYELAVQYAHVRLHLRRRPEAYFVSPTMARNCLTEAEAFARAVLMPCELVKELTDQTPTRQWATECVTAFRVPSCVARKRLTELKQTRLVTSHELKL